jgi:hypothetical protein
MRRWIFVLLRWTVGPTIRRMQVREAKDFLVQETAKQAGLLMCSCDWGAAAAGDYRAA